MNQFIKQFLGPSWKIAIIKIVLGILLFIVVTFIHTITWPVVDYWAYGWPLHFSESWGPCFLGEVCYNRNTFALVFDIVFWYLILCLIIFLYKKVRGKTAA